jgi:hypothetical protein
MAKTSWSKKYSLTVDDMEVEMMDELKEALERHLDRITEDDNFNANVVADFRDMINVLDFMINSEDQD